MTWGIFYLALARKLLALKFSRLESWAVSVLEDGSVGLEQRNLFDSSQAFQGNIRQHCSTAALCHWLDKVQELQEA